MKATKLHFILSILSLCLSGASPRSQTESYRVDNRPRVVPILPKNLCMPIPHQPWRPIRILSSSDVQRLIQDIAALSLEKNNSPPIVSVDSSLPYDRVQPILSALSKKTSRALFEIDGEGRCAIEVQLVPPPKKRLLLSLRLSSTNTSLRVNELAYSARVPVLCPTNGACAGGVELASGLREMRQFFGPELLVSIDGENTQKDAPSWRQIVEALVAAVRSAREGIADPLESTPLLGVLPPEIRRWTEEAQVFESDGYPKGVSKVFANLVEEAVVGGPSLHTRREIYRAVIARHHEELVLCYAKGLSESPGLAGHVKVSWSLNALDEASKAADSGTIMRNKDERGYPLFPTAGVRLEASTLHNGAVENCILRTFRALRFPLFHSGEARIQWPLSFNPETRDVVGPDNHSL